MDAANATPEDLLANLNWVHGLARSLVRDPGAAEDVVQQTWIAAQREPEQARSRAWVARVAHNFVRQRGRSEGRRRLREESVSRGEALPSAAQLAERTERQRIVMNAVMELREPYRSTVLLRYVDGLEPTEIARQQGLPPSTVRSRSRRALDQLREALDARYGSRDSWCALLLPLARIPLPVLPVSAPQSGALLFGAVLMKKAMLGIGVLLAAVAAVFVVRDKPALESGRQAALRSPAVQAQPGQEPAAGPAANELGVRVTAAPVPEASRGPGKLQAPPVPAGWWLTGEVRGVPEIEKTSIEVRTKELEPIYGKVRADGFVLLDLAPHFLDPELLCTGLEVVLSHPLAVPQTITFQTSREQRQAGYLPDGRAEFALAVQLKPAVYTVRGRVDLPAEYGAQDLRVALLDAGGAELEVVDQASLAKAGDYVLCAGSPGDYVVVAWEHREFGLLGPERPRPAEARLRVEGACEGIDLELDWGVEVTGQISGGLGLAGLEWVVSCQLPRADQFLLDDLALVDGRLDYELRHEQAGRGGSFRFRGLAPGAYSIGLSGIHQGGESLEFNWGDVISDSQTVTAPARGVQLRIGLKTLGIVVRGEGRPLAQAKAVIYFENGSSRTSVGEDGRVVLALGLAESAERYEFQHPGFQTRVVPADSVATHAGEWMAIDLEPRELASLELVVSGDPERLVERLGVSLQVPGDPDSTIERDLRRTERGAKLEGVPPGSYDVLVRLDPRAFWTERMPFLPVRFSVELQPGEDRVQNLELRRGGLVSLPAGTFGGEAQLYFRVFGPDGQPVQVEAVSRGEFSWSRSSANLVRDRNGFLEPALPEGVYSLEVWADDLARRRIPLTLRAGETTEVSGQ